MLALAVTAPLLGPGYLLLRDAVSTPRSYLTDAALGLTQAAPRALPQDVAVAWASAVLDGGAVVKALLILGIWLAGWGAARLAAALLPDAGLPGQCVAATIAIWNPYVAERLLQGHWSLLVGYGALPWVAGSVLALRSAPKLYSTREKDEFPRVECNVGGIGAALFWLALAGLTPTGLMLAATVALACAVAPGPGRSRLFCAAVSLAAATTAALPWLVASAVADGWSSGADQGPAVSAFAARAEPGLGTLGSLAGLGGIWNADAVPASRTGLFAVVATVVLLAVVAIGVPVLIRRRAGVPLLVLAVAAVAVPALMATGPGLAAVEAVIEAVPGLGVVRDGQKWVALAMPGYALAGAAAVVTLRPRVPVVATAAVCCAAVIATLPDLVWGVGGKVRPGQYPPAWREAAAVIDTDPAPVAVLPVDSMRRFAWAGPAPVLDPLPRWLRAEVLATGDLSIGGRTVPGEGVHAREVQAMLLAGADRDQLAAAGVGWVVVEGSGANLALPVAFRDSELTVYRVGGDSPSSPHRGVVLAAHGVWLAQLVVGLGAMALRRFRSRGADGRHEQVEGPERGDE
ncbi:hypothetical protein [Mycolicibacterium chubuense]|uniref:Transmembrane protein n=1 Tax=Mycolicibacterium chubuense TaxID=1800 RepID=A0A0J6VN03_MYCCU|nr:hypothetical protein [Mycolicibacterium chubuense]KMO72425.1 hypothetical protein MCHUDSM44219_04935 [Mycolicibacterium chubuense]SPX99175.1 transmembrane protein [Mycolicibacterium chubuense]